ncbi:hypothetical protein D3C76_163580 [compost metagenome]
MSATTIKEFLVSLGLNVEGAAGFDQAVGKATLVVAGLGTAVFAATGLLFGFTKAIAEQYDELGDLSNRIDVSVAAIEEFGYVAQLTGSDVATANASLEQFSKTAGDAANGMGRGQKVFEQLGISVTDANGKVKETTGLLGEVGDKIKDMERGQQTAILGRLGLDRTLVDALTTDVSGLRAEFKALYDATGLDANVAAEKAGKFMDAFDRLNVVISTVGKSLAVNFMDRFTDALDNLRKLIVDNLPVIMRTLKPIIALILALADTFIAITYRIGQGAGVIIGWIATIVENTNKWVLAIVFVILAWKKLNLAFLLSPVGAIIAIGVALGLLVDDFMTWKEGGESLIPWENWQAEIDMAAAVLKVFEKALENWFMVLFGISDAVGKLFTGDVAGSIESLKGVFQSMADFVSSLFGPILEAIGAKFGITFEDIENVVRSLGNVFKSVFDYIAEVIDNTLGKVRAAVDWAKSAVNAVSSVIPGMGEEQQTSPRFNNSPMIPPPSAPSPIMGGKLSPQTIQQETNIIIQGGANPQTTAKAVAGEQSQVNGDMARNLKGAVR